MEFPSNRVVVTTDLKPQDLAGGFRRNPNNHLAKLQTALSENDDDAI